MPRWRLTALLSVLMVPAWVGGAVRPVPGLDAEGLQGIWEVTSVRRDGEADPTQVGGYVRFSGDTVEFLPRVRQVSAALS